MQQTDRDRFDPLGRQPLREALELGFPERRHHLSGRAQPFAELEPEAPLDQRPRLFEEEVVHLRSADPPQLEHVAESQSRDQRGPGSAVLEDGIGGYGRAVRDLGNDRAGGGGLVEQAADGLQDAPFEVRRSRRHLARADPVPRIEHDDVGERAAHVGGDQERGLQHGRQGSGIIQSNRALATPRDAR